MKQVVGSAFVSFMLSALVSPACAQDHTKTHAAPAAATSPDPEPAQKPAGAGAAPQESALPSVEVIQEKPKQPTPKLVAKRKPVKSQAASAAVLGKPIPAQPPEVDTSSDQPAGGASTPPGTVDAYVAKVTSSATKTATPITEIPQSITNVTRQQLEDRKPISIEAALGYVPGTRTDGAGFDPRFDCVNIRGFDCLSGDALFRDGLRQMSSPFGSFRNELYGIDSFTVLRGPSSMLYGAGSAGGIVDLYTKRPTDVPFHEVEFIAGNHDRFQGNFDFSGPIYQGSSTLYRLTGIVRDSDTQQLGVEDNRFFIAPALSFKPDDATKITVFGEYMNSNAGGNMAYWNDYLGGDHVRRTDIVSGDPAFNDFPQDQIRVGYEIEHRFNDSLMLRQKARYGHIDSRLEYIDIAIPYDNDGNPLPSVGPLDATGLPVNGIFPRAAGTLTDRMQTAVMDNSAEVKFVTGPLKHRVLAGVDLSYLTYSEAEGFETDEILYDADGNPIDINIGSRIPPLVNFNYGAAFIPDPALIARTDQNLFSVGTYFQDQIKLDRWLLTIGARHDWVSTKTTWQDYASDPTAVEIQQKDDSAWSKRAALSYLFDSGFAPYVAYATSFNPTAGTSPPDADDPVAFDPVVSESKEVGFKYAPAGVNFMITGALFDITQENSLVAETFIRDGVQLQRLTQAGVLQSRGGEIEAAATFANGFSFLASYSYIDMTIVKGDDDLNNGHKLSSIPFNTVSLWLDYTMKNGAARGLGMGGGVRYIGASFGNDENTFKNASRTFIDLSAHYDLDALGQQFKGARLQINANNVFDVEKDICQSDYCYRDLGRTVIGSLRYRW